MATSSYKIEGTASMLLQLRNLAIKAAKTPSVLVGYTAEYATKVHEDLNMNHPNGGQAKFLEQPAREIQRDLKETIRKEVQAGGTIEDALLLAGMRLQAASQKLVPVDTGNLRGSAFTEFRSG